MSEHIDALDTLNSQASLKEKIVSTHEILKKKLPFIARISITLYDPETEILKTFLHSSGDDNPLEHYQSSLSESHSLKKLLEKAQPRVINNLLTFEQNGKEHSKRIGRQGYAASYTMPIFQKGNFTGFLFFNSYETDVFTEKVLTELDVFGHLISLLVINEVSSIKVINAAVRTSTQMAHVRDPETGSHLDRMSRYSRLIAQKLANKYDLNDDYIEHVFMFAPLHDIGKIAIPDDILLKPDSLNAEEMQKMQEHARKGRELIDNMIENFDLSSIENIEMLKNIAEYHHESVNGTGYPDGLKGDEIPLEARIVAVSDIFDALTSKRCYKDAWSNEQAIELLQKLAGETLDKDCVDALLACEKEIEDIQFQFKEDVFGLK